MPTTLVGRPSEHVTPVIALDDYPGLTELARVMRLPVPGALLWGIAETDQHHPYVNYGDAADVWLTVEAAPHGGWAAMDVSDPFAPETLAYSPKSAGDAAKRAALVIAERMSDLAEEALCGPLETTETPQQEAA